MTGERYRGIVERGDGSLVEMTYEAPRAVDSTATASDFRTLDGELLDPLPGETWKITFAGGFTVTVTMPVDEP